MSDPAATAPEVLQEFVRALFKFAKDYPGQPVAVIDDGESLKLGVMSLLNPEKDDWCLNPVEVDRFLAGIEDSLK